MLLQTLLFASWVLTSIYAFPSGAEDKGKSPARHHGGASTSGSSHDLLRFQMIRMMSVPEEFCELFCQAVTNQLSLQLAYQITHSRDPYMMITKDSKLSLMDDSEPAYTYIRAHDLSQQERRPPTIPSDRFNAVKQTCESIDAWFLLLLLAQGNYKKTNPSGMKTDYVQEATAATIAMCAAYKTIRSMFNTATSQQVGTCVCFAEVAITDVRLQTSGARNRVDPAAVARRFAVDEWQVIEESARSYPMSTLGNDQASYRSPPCVGDTRFRCHCSSDQCEYGFLELDYKELRSSFQGTLWSMLPQAVRNRLSSMISAPVQSEMKRRTGEEFMANFIGSAFPEETTSAAADLQNQANADRARADFLFQRAQEMRTPDGALGPTGRALLDEVEQLRSNAAHLEELAKSVASGFSSMR